jgi:hypothetical protein
MVNRLLLRVARDQHISPMRSMVGSSILSFGTTSIRDNHVTRRRRSRRPDRQRTRTKEFQSKPFKLRRKIGAIIGIGKWGLHDLQPIQFDRSRGVLSITAVAARLTNTDRIAERVAAERVAFAPWNAGLAQR